MTIGIQDTLPRQQGPASGDAVGGLRMTGGYRPVVQALEFQSGTISGLAADQKAYADKIGTTTHTRLPGENTLDQYEQEQFHALVSGLSDRKIAEVALHPDTVRANTEVAAASLNMFNEFDEPEAAWLTNPSSPHELSYDERHTGIRDAGEMAQDSLNLRIENLRSLSPEAVSKMATDTAKFIRAMRAFEMTQSYKG